MQFLMRRVGSLMALAVLTGALGACGSTVTPHAHKTTSSTGHVLPGAPPANWDNPIRGKPVASLPSLLGQFQFPVRLPLAFGHMRGAFVSRDYEPGDPPENLVLELVYNHPRFGRVVVLEFATPGSRSAFEKWEHYEAESSGKPGTYGTAEFVRLSSGQEVLAGTNSAGTGSYVAWYEPWPAGHDFEIEIFGQAMDQPGIVSLAEQLSRPGGYRTAG